MKITSIFLSVNGEVCKAGQGSWTVFVRTFGCSARCSYCDSSYAWKDGAEYKKMTPREILAEILLKDPGCDRVTLTGGEPLEQDSRELEELIGLLQRVGYEISIETNGLYMDTVNSLKTKFPSTSFVSDFKLPGSNIDCDLFYVVDDTDDEGNPIKETSYNLDDIKPYVCTLCENDFIKFIIQDRYDFDVALGIVDDLEKIIDKEFEKWGREYKLPKIYFSPCNMSSPDLLFSWMKEANCAEQNIGFNYQIHKAIFPEDWRKEEKC
jgi:7-carboxy-7-deazaguanine synthase